MKKEISSIELRQIISEMQFLLDASLDKITIEDNNDLYLSFYVRSKGSFMARVVPGKYIYLTKQKPKSTEPDPFCLSLRKNLINAILKGIEQLGSERILKFVFETKNEKLSLFIELFAKGNIILCNENDLIINLLEKQAWKDRTMAVNRKYEYPKKEFNIFELKKEDLEKLNESKADSLVKALAAEIGFGGIYAEEICILADADKNIAPKKLTEIDINAVYNAIRELLKKRPEPRIIIKDDEIMNIVPFDLEYYESCEFESFDSYNGALDTVLSKEISEREEIEHSKEYLKKAEKIKNIMVQQEKNLTETNKIVGDNQRKGEFIYETYALVKEILDELNRAKERYSWAEIKEKLKGHKMIKSINEKEKKVVVEI